MWRSMLISDLSRVNDIANHIHADFFEAPEVFEEKLTLYPQGCFVFETDQVEGYAFTHPWVLMKPPKLNSFLTTIEGADSYYIHDVVLLPTVRGQHNVEKLFELLNNTFDTMSLISVNQSTNYWNKFGFEKVELDVSNYSDDATYMIRKIK